MLRICLGFALDLLGICARAPALERLTSSPRLAAGARGFAGRLPPLPSLTPGGASYPRTPARGLRSRLRRAHFSLTFPDPRRGVRGVIFVSLGSSVFGSLGPCVFGSLGLWVFGALLVPGRPWSSLVVPGRPWSSLVRRSAENPSHRVALYIGSVTLSRIIH